MLKIIVQKGRWRKHDNSYLLNETRRIVYYILSMGDSPGDVGEATPEGLENEL